MPNFPLFKLSYVALALVAVTFLAVSMLTLHDDHNWGGDFSQYIMHAQNLLHCRDYRSGIVMNYSFQQYHPAFAPRSYPPLFPLVLTPILALRGVDLWWLKVPNIFLWLLWVAVMYSILKRMLGQTHAVLLSLVLMFSPWFFRFKQQILSDVLFAFLVAAALLIYMRSIERRERITAQALGSLTVCLILAALTRTAAHPAFLACILHLSLFERKYPAAGVLTVAWIALTIAGQMLGLADSLTCTSLAIQNNGLGLLRATWDHGVYTFSQTVCFLSPQYWTPHPVLLMLLLVLMVVGFVARVRSNAGFSIVEIFVALYLIMLVAYPIPQGPRFVLPTEGLLLAYGVIGLRVLFDLISGNRWGRNAVTAVLLGTLVYCAAATWKDRGFYDGVLKSPAMESLAAWMKENTGPDEHYLFRKPRALALLTGRTGLPTPKTPQVIRKVCMEQGIRWVILTLPGHADTIKSFRVSPDFRFAWRYPGIHIFEYLPCSRQ